MKKTKINLLTSKQDYARVEQVFLWLRRLTIGYAAVFFLFVAGVFVLQSAQTLQLNGLLKEKEQLLADINAKSSQEAKLVYIAKKGSLLNAFLKDDAHFIPYYTLLVDTLKSTSQSATLSSFEIDKKRNVTFDLSFANFDDMIKSFQFIESDSFVGNFQELVLKNFQRTVASGGAIDLSFTGVFKNLDEKK